jgi:hypothetical protein
VFETVVVRKICGSKRDKVRGDWRELYSVELHDLYSSSNIE